MNSGHPSRSRCNRFTSALPDPTLGTGEIVVDVVAAGVAGYASSIFSGERNYLLELPIVPGPGGIGRVRATGPDTTRLSVGDWVFCDATIRSRDDAVNPDTILVGWTARDEAALPLHRYYHNGAYAERMMLPTENVTPLDEITPADAGRWCALSQLLVPYGGLAAGDLRPGETVVVNGATGGFGGAGVAVALALGAAQVVATGRNQQTLDELVRRLGPRVRAAAMTGVEEDDRRLIRESAGGPIDFVLDFLPRMATGSQVRAAALAVRPGGRIVLMGGVGGSGGGDLELPYSWLMRHDITVRGKWMYPRDAVAAMIRIARAGLIDLSRFDVVEFGLDEVNEAVAHAAARPGPFHLTVVRPAESAVNLVAFSSP